MEDNIVGEKVMSDVLSGQKNMREVEEKNYLGDILTKDGKNSKNINERTNKAQGNINHIVNSLMERPYGVA